ncbi:hypothetical protein [Caulobacter hibisci]|uniref:Uncharacterized protein n=1 Tax=Caulobacter hibisci TaxID=2035993 RepID=A0ABS0T321_9CAUL|nr:hypothetical protein [Caulobacter hibisci]MBI1685470.1 hypothetical protein [Caulobacter hibisci]
MGETPNNQGLQQQPNDASRPQVEQQNQQGERTPQQQQQNPQQAQPDQQNRQADRRDGERADGDQLNDGLAGGVDTGAIEPGRTDEGGAER